MGNDLDNYRAAIGIFVCTYKLRKKHPIRYQFNHVTCEVRILVITCNHLSDFIIIYTPVKFFCYAEYKIFCSTVCTLG